MKIWMVGLCFAFCSCSSGGGGGASATLSGEFLDSAVGGVAYASGDLSGFTSTQGMFQYKDGGNVTISIGGITLPVASGAAVLTPVQLVTGAADQMNPTVTNVARFLQSLDDDQDLSNGISITPAVHTAAAGLSVNFNQSILDFGSDGNVLSAISTLTSTTSAGQRPMVSAASAQSHLESTILGIFAGPYSGTFTGSGSGTWAITIDTAGSITGDGDSIEDGSFSITGSVNSSGSASFLGGSVSTGATFQGTLNLEGSIGGTWENSSFGESGTWSGSAS